MSVLIHLLTILFGFISFVIIKNQQYKDVPFVSLVMILSFVGCGIVSLVVLFVPYGELLLLPLSSVVLGVIFLLVLMNDLYSLLRCKEKIEGFYCGYHTYYGGRGVTTQAPIFEYMYKNQLYKEQTTQTISYKQVSKMNVGDSYPIYIDPKYPSVFIFQKKIKMSFILLLFFGLLFLVGGLMSLRADFLKFVL